MQKKNTLANNQQQIDKSILYDPIINNDPPNQRRNQSHTNLQFNHLKNQDVTISKKFPLNIRQNFQQSTSNSRQIRKKNNSQNQSEENYSQENEQYQDNESSNYSQNNQLYDDKEKNINEKSIYSNYTFYNKNIEQNQDDQSEDNQYSQDSNYELSQNNDSQQQYEYEDQQQSSQIEDQEYNESYIDNSQEYDNESNEEQQYNNSYEDQDQDQENEDDQISQNSYNNNNNNNNNNKNRPQISSAAFRILNFEMRKNDPTIPRGAAKLTQRDEQGKRIENKEEIKQIITSNLQFQKQNNYEDQNKEESKQLIKKQDQQQISSKIEEQKKRMYENMKLRKEEQLQKQYDNQDSIAMQNRRLIYYFETPWLNRKFTDNMCTEQNITDAYNLKIYDEIFEVDKNFHLCINQIVKPYIRSNQGKEENEVRSQIGIKKSINRLHEIFCQRQFFKEDGEEINIIDIYQYISNRYRAINTELEQIESNNSDVFIFRIQYREQLIRIYLLSYIEMIQADQQCQKDKNYMDKLKDNQGDCKKYIIKALEGLIVDYSMLFQELTPKRYFLLDNLPEFIQYYCLQLTLTLLETSTIQALSKLDQIIQQEFIYTNFLMESEEYIFCKKVQECMLLKNFCKLLEEVNKSEYTVFQLFFIYLLQEQMQRFENKVYNTVIISTNQKNFTLPYLSINKIFEKMSTLDKDYIINQRGNFSEIILGNYIKPKQKEILQPIKQSNLQQNVQKKKNINECRNVLLNVAKKLIINGLSSFLSQHYEQIEIQLGNIYRLRRLFNHWKLFYYQSKRQNQFEKACKSKVSTIKSIKKIYIENTYKRYLIASIINKNLSSDNLYFKIVIINLVKEKKVLNKLINCICDNNYPNDSLIFDFDVATALKQYRFYLSIQIMEELEVERTCGTDLYILLGENQYSLNKPYLNIIFNDIQGLNNQDNIFQAEYLENFENIYDHYFFKTALNKVTEESIIQQEKINDLKFVTFQEAILSIPKITLFKFQSQTIENFIEKCISIEMCLYLYLNNCHSIDTLPQEILFNQFISQANITEYIAKFNPANKLMIPIIQQLKQPLTFLQDLINILDNYLQGYTSQEKIKEILNKYLIFGETIKGDWGQLFDSIIEQAIENLKDDSITFVVNKNFYLKIDQTTFDTKVQQDIQLLLNKSQQKIPTLKPSKQNQIFNFELQNWIQKKICK